MQLPVWTSHKTVEAFKIANIIAQPRGTAAGNVLEPQEVKVPRSDGKVDVMFSAMHTEYVLVDETGDYSAVVSDGYMEKHGAYLDGYYVRYSNGYESFSPADAFEDGHVQKGKRRVIHLLVDQDAGLTIDDMTALLEMFKNAVVDNVGAVIATQDCVQAELVDVQDSPDLELVTVHVTEFENSDEDDDGEEIIPEYNLQHSVLHIYGAGVDMPNVHGKHEIHVRNEDSSVKQIRGRPVQHIVLHGVIREELCAKVEEAAKWACVSFEQKYQCNVIWEEQ